MIIQQDKFNLANEYGACWDEYIDDKGVLSHSLQYSMLRGRDTGWEKIFELTLWLPVGEVPEGYSTLANLMPFLKASNEENDQHIGNQIDMPFNWEVGL